MPIRTVTHLNFRGNARAALAFYHGIFKGQQVVVSYADAGRAGEVCHPDHVLWGQVTGNGGIALMAYDVPTDLDWNPGERAFFISLRGDDENSIRGYWEGLADGADILYALAPSQWSPLYGMLKDRFGITWVVDVAAP